PLKSGSPSPSGALTNPSPARISQTDQAQAPYISLSIANSDGPDNAPATEYPRPGWRACIPLSAAAYADELGTVAQRLCLFVGSFAGTKLALLEFRLPSQTRMGCCLVMGARLAIQVRAMDAHFQFRP